MGRARVLRCFFVVLASSGCESLGMSVPDVVVVAGEAAPRRALAGAFYPGMAMPVLGLGTWKAPRAKTAEAVEAAVRAGYRLVDCANDYGNEAAIGATLRKLIDEGVVTREDLFLQAKLWNSNHRPEHVAGDLDATLRDLQTDYVDSFVMHWPMACPAHDGAACAAVYGRGNHRAAHKAEGTMLPLEADGTYASDSGSHYVATWHAMEALVDAGRARSIGLSNFNRRQCAEVIANARRYKPAVLQNECHAYLQQKDLLDYCNHEGLLFQAYSPLGSRDRPWASAKGPSTLTAGPPAGGAELLDHPMVLALAQKHSKSAAQVLLRWHWERGVCTIPKSSSPERVLANMDIFDFNLAPEDVAAFDVLNVGWRHLLWPETSKHPDYPFKDELPYGYVAGPDLGAPKEAPTWE